MSTTTDNEKYIQLIHQIDPHYELRRAWPLTGGVSAQTTALEVRLPDGRTRKLVVRRHGAVDRRLNPQIAGTEFRLLQIVHQAGLPAPAPYHLEPAGPICAIPAIVIAFIDGQPDFEPADLPTCLRQLAATLAAIHGIDARSYDLSFLYHQRQGFGERPAVLDPSMDEGRIRDALAALWPLSRHNPPVLLHGDFWPGNILWRDGRLVGVVDWEDAIIGDPLLDLARARLEIMWGFGVEAMGLFTTYYRLLMPELDYTHLPYWDLCAALRPAGKLAAWGLDPAVEAAMRAGHKVFVEQALGRQKVYPCNP